MSSSQQMTLPQATMRWSMPIVLENYDRRPLTAKERQALDFLRTSRTRGGLDPRSCWIASINPLPMSFVFATRDVLKRWYGISNI